MTHLSARMRFVLLVTAIGVVSTTTSMIRGDQFLDKVRLAEATLLQVNADEAADRAAEEKPAAPVEEDDVEANFPSGAGLKTDPELEGLLKRAEGFVDDGRYDLATILWQRVLDESGETVMTRRDRKSVV